jgi:hypothetical protein
MAKRSRRLLSYGASGQMRLAMFRTSELLVTRKQFIADGRAFCLRTYSGTRLDSDRKSKEARDWEAIACYSYRSATMGSTLAALRAGM